MSAEDLGKRLLGEIEEERLDELLSSLRVLQDPSSSHRLGIKQIDELLALFANQNRIHNQTSRQAEAPTSHDNDDHSRTTRIPLLQAQAKAPPIIELTSPSSNDGKSQLLYYLTATLVLPAELKDVHLGGQNAAVVILDTECRFSVERLFQVMHHFIRARITAITTNQNECRQQTPEAVTSPIPTNQHIQDLISDNLRHVHIFRPQSLPSLIATLSSLTTYLFDPSAHVSHHKRIGAILLDSASSFFWQDKADLENATLPSDTSSTTSSVQAKKPLNTQYIALASALKRASAALQAPVVYTTWHLSPPAATSADNSAAWSSIRPHLPPPWPSLPTLRLTISRRAVRKFPPGMTAAEASNGQAARRSLAVSKGVFDIGVDMWGCENWRDEVREGVVRGGMVACSGGGIEVRISDQGVVVEE